MKHLTLKAAVTTTTDQGLFEAVISTETADREKDVVSAAAMVNALRKWNRPLPLAWDHNTTAENIFGAIDTQSPKAVDGEVVVDGQVDMESTVGKEAWRAFKARTIGFSFGYLILHSTKIKGGGRNITALDVFEVTATPTPMNNDTRVLSTKAAQADPESTEPTEDDPTDTEPEPLDARELRKRTFEAAHEVARNHPVVRKAVAEVVEPPSESESEEAEPDEEVPAAPVTVPRPDQEKPVEVVDEIHLHGKTTVHTIKGGVHTVTQVSAVEEGSTEELKVEEPEAKVAPQDPLRKRTYEVALGISNGGMRVRKYIEPVPELEPLDAAALRRRSDELALDIARG